MAVSALAPSSVPTPSAVRRGRWPAIAVVLLLLLLLALPGRAAAEGGDEIADEVLVGLTPQGQQQAAEVHARAGGVLERQIARKPVQVVKVNPSGEAAARAAYASDPRVRFVEHNARVSIAATPNDPGFAQQWALARIQAPAAWDAATGGGLVAVIDTGVDPTHPDLKGQIAAVANFTSAADAYDHNGHGTHVAGLIAARMNDGIGGVGVAPGAHLLVAKALDDKGNGTYATVIEALEWSVNHGATIVNRSFAGSVPSQALADAVASAQARGVLVVAAAGNGGNGAPTYPAALPGVLSVAATDRNDAVASFSTSGPWVSVGAPGVDAYSTLPGGRYGSMSGTSMAAAEAAGVAALAAAAAPNASGAALRDFVVDGSDKVAASGRAFAAGRIDARRAVELAAQRGATLPTPTPTPTPAIRSWRGGPSRSTR